MYAKGLSGVTSPAETTTQQITDVVEKGIAMLKMEIGSAKKSNCADSQEDTSNGVSAKPYVIDNVREFKSSLPISAGARPVKDLSEYEELDSKL